MDDEYVFGEEYHYDYDADHWLIEESPGQYRSGGTSDFTDLRVWQDSMDLAVRVYRITESFPREERIGLSGQMRRCAVSVPSNIAEGQARGSVKDFARFLNMARGSVSELQTQILLGQRLGYLDESESHLALEHAMRVTRQVSALTRSILANLN